MTAAAADTVPYLPEEALAGVRSRRVAAFLIDYALIALFMAPVWLIVAVLGLLTFGFGFALFGVVFPLTALSYVALTLGGPRQATFGMQAMDIRIERLDGRFVDPMTAIVHTVLFWLANAIFSPLILLATLFTWRKRTLHDNLLGAQVVRASISH
ncbi:MAG: RDD family protein [Phyllobacteriaceae bacterium]|nr:RDD family protein [Phyllobacteriaceae bacterium]